MITDIEINIYSDDAHDSTYSILRSYDKSESEYLFINSKYTYI